MDNNHKTAIVYHYFAHYRRPILELLCRQPAPLEYFLIADECANLPSLSVLQRSDIGLDQVLVNKWYPVRNIWFFRQMLWQRGLIQHALFGPYDTFIFLGNAYFVSTWIAAVLAKLRGKKIYMWTHGALKHEASLKGAIRKTFYRLADGLLLYGNRAKQILINQGFDDKRLHVIYNSLDYVMQRTALSQIMPEALVVARSKLGFAADDIVIIAIARLTKEKRFDLLIQAMRMLTTRNPAYKLLVLGDGPYLESMRALAKQLKVDNHIVFCGASYDEVDIATKMLISDVAVVPGDVGLSCIHSLTYGIPMITHDRFETHGPEFEAIIDGVTGGFYEFDNVESLTDLIEAWSARMQTEREHISEQCQSVISQHYNPAFQCQAIGRVIMKVN